MAGKEAEHGIELSTFCVQLKLSSAGESYLDVPEKEKRKRLPKL
ncbi:MAG: hypothetical protein NTW67_06685 [Candidatus Woesearchaeota archaeon]|nr:hypothetical protein [Candidatus Woesearchaeota archaeon]